MIADPRAPVPAGTSIRAISLAAVLAALAPSAASALPPHGPTPPTVYLQPAQAEAPAAGERTVEDFKAALAEIKRRLAEQRQALTTGDQAAAVAQEAKAARVQIERLTGSMADLRRERDAMRGELLDTRSAAEALQTQLSDAQAQLQAARSGAAEQVQALQLERDQAKAARSALEAQLADVQQQLAGGTSARQELTATVEQLKRQVDEAGTALAAKERDRVQSAAQLAEQKTEAARLEQELSVAKTLDARLTDEVGRTRAALDAANARGAEIAKEVDGLRAVAAASVDEVGSLGEQLMGALADNRQLAAALGDLRAGTDLLGRQLDGPATPANATVSGVTDGAAGGNAASPARAGTGDEAQLGARPVVARLETDEDASAAEPIDGKRRKVAMTRIDGSVFGSGSADLRPEAAPSLAIAAAFLRSQPAAGRVRIVGFTDSVGEDSSNLELSVRRAEAVRDYLVRTHGLTPERLIAGGMGEAEPVAGNDTEAGRRSNRRVEIYIEP
jgi:outer membrane protein OmpA-like peptidoglycan-associated protein/predicted  nucleic acid-binding Zn-ribbon protein